MEFHSYPERSNPRKMQREKNNPLSCPRKNRKKKKIIITTGKYINIPSHNHFSTTSTKYDSEEVVAVLLFAAANSNTLHDAACARGDDRRATRVRRALLQCSESSSAVRKRGPLGPPTPPLVRIRMV